MGGPGGQRCEETVLFLHIASKFRKLSKVSEDIEMKMSFFLRTTIISSAVENSYGQKRLRMAAGSEKKLILGKRNFFTLTEVAAVIRGLKSGKAAGEDKIRPEILTALNGEEYVSSRGCVRWRGN